MRNAIGKGNDARKVLTYYRVNCGVRPPYRVLCDAPIIHVAPHRDIVLKDALPKLLCDNTSLVVTRCIVEELRALGEDFARAAALAKRLPREPCAHGASRKSSSDCIQAIIQRGNTTGIVIASNDVDVLQSAEEQGSFPVVTIANQTRLVLRKPSAKSILETQQSKEKQSAVLSRSEQAILDKTKAERKWLKPKQTIRKRKRAKGPNPLSVKKSKKNKDKMKPNANTLVDSQKSPATPVESTPNQEGRTGRKRRKRNKPRTETDNA